MDIFDKHYSAIWKALIRPPREVYKRNQLGPSNFQINEHPCKRYDIAMPNSRNKSLECSYYKMKERNQELPVVIYLHGNSSSRLTAVSYVNQLLKHFNVFTIDLSGSGRSEGEYISLGYHEKDDLQIAIQYLREEQGAKEVFIWGRSMGAVTGLLYCAKYKGINGLILDSPFSDLEVLVKEAASSYVSLPDFILNAFIDNIREHIKKLMKETEGYEFDILKLKPINDITKITIPTYFITAKEDKLVKSDHTISLFKKCESKVKKLDLIEGGHNGPRGKQLVEKIISFIKDHSRILREEEREIENIDVQNEFESLLMCSKKIIKENSKFIQNDHPSSKQHLRPARKTQ